MPSNVKYFVSEGQPLGPLYISTLNKWKPEYKMNKVLPEIFFLFSNNNPGDLYDDRAFYRRSEFLYNKALFEEKALILLKNM